MKTICLAAICALSPIIATADTCLTGAWQADLSEIATTMERQMGGSAQVLAGGAVMTVVDSGAMEVIVNSLKISVTPPNVPTVEVTINGYSRGTLSSDGNRFNALVADYRLVGSSVVLGQRMDIPFDSSTGMFGTASGTYTCSGDALQMEPADASPQNGVIRQWRRIG